MNLCTNLYTYFNLKRKYRISGQTVAFPKRSTQITKIAPKIISAYFYHEVCRQNTGRDTMFRVYYS